MKVLIDGTPLLRERTGVGRYTKQLLEAVLDLDRSSQYVVYGYVGTRGQVLPVTAANLRYRLVRMAPRRLLNTMHRELHLAPPADLVARVRPDVVLFPNNTMVPVLGRAKRVVVVHDLAFKRHPDFFTTRHRRFLDRFVPEALDRASAIVTVSEFTKRELSAVFGIDRARVTVIPNGVDVGVFRPVAAEAVDEVRARYGLPAGYLLSVGTLEPRKNLVRLLHAYAALPQHLKRSHPLVLVGPRGWHDAEIVATLDELQRSGEPVKRLGYVAELDLASLYAGAAAFVFPSLYEGFGLPALEAMASGTPVVASNCGSVREVVGDAALLVEPTDAASITAGLERVLGDAAVAQQLRARGPARAGAFSWRESALRLLSLFEDLVQPGRVPS
jgi:alpha-1,3-rhamnosyl/mannosyltransferase